MPPSPRRELLPRWGDPRWQLAAATPYGQALRRELADLQVADGSTAFPALTPELYSQVHRTGERLPFERVYQERRRRLARSAVRLLLERPAGPDGSLRPQGAGWSQLLVAIDEVMSEPAWALPAHVRDPSGIGAEAIDLFAAETANLCGELVSLFGPWLPPDCVTRMRQRVLDGMVSRFLARPAAFWWTNKTTNWNAVCHQGLLGGALGLGLEGPRLEQLLALGERHLQLFLEGFSAAGTCLEGLTYWSYGFGFFVLLNEQLECWSGGERSLVNGRLERIRAIARFGPAMLLRNGSMVNMADTRIERPPRACLLMYLGRRLQLPECTQAGIRLYGNLLESRFDRCYQRSDLLYFTRMLLEAPSAEVMAAVEESSCGDWIDHEAGLIVVRRLDRFGRCWELAVKGGHNGEPHNHNDCGSFLLNVDGQRLAIELGAPEYRADTFGADRYSLFATRSAGHSIPLVRGMEQAAGRSHAAELLEVEALPGRVSVCLDLASAYPLAAGQRRLRRQITLDCESASLLVEDELLGAMGSGLESVLLTEIRDASVLGLEPLEGSQLARMEPVHFNDNRGEPMRAWRWFFHPSTGVAMGDDMQLLRTAYRFQPQFRP